MTYPAWVPCPNQCGDFFCTVHGKHVFECGCLPVEDWERVGIDPYTQGGKPLSEWGIPELSDVKKAFASETAPGLAEMGPRQRLAYAAAGRLDEKDCIADPTPIHSFFGLSYASYLVLPRTILQSLPQEIQFKLVTVLKEIDDRTPTWPPDGYHYEVHLHMTDYDEEDNAREEDREAEHPKVSDPLCDYERGRRQVTSKDIEGIKERYTGRSAEQ